MQTKTTVTAIFNCTLERAFKTPMLCDVKKVHGGYGPMPRVYLATDDATWGQMNGSRKIFMEKSIFFKGGEAFLDTVLVRTENQYWKIELSDFKFWAFGFEKFQGEWYTNQNPDGTILITYIYTLFFKNPLAYPFYWLFTKTVWRAYIKHALQNIKELAENNEPYTHS